MLSASVALDAIAEVMAEKNNMAAGELVGFVPWLNTGPKPRAEPTAQPTEIKVTAGTTIEILD